MPAWTPRARDGYPSVSPSFYDTNIGSDPFIFKIYFIIPHRYLLFLLQYFLSFISIHLLNFSALLLFLHMNSQHFCKEISQLGNLISSSQVLSFIQLNKYKYIRKSCICKHNLAAPYSLNVLVESSISKKLPLIFESCWTLSNESKALYFGFYSGFLQLGESSRSGRSSFFYFKG